MTTTEIFSGSLQIID